MFFSHAGEREAPQVPFKRVKLGLEKCDGKNPGDDVCRA
jgi:hypothetical protein